MGVLDDVRQWLKETPLWQELGKMPDRMDALEKRMTAMEKRLEKKPGLDCPKCGQESLRFSVAGRRMGGHGNTWREDLWKCEFEECGYQEHRKVVI